MEYLGSKIDVTRLPSGLATVKFTQPVLLQKLRDEFDLPGGKNPKTPAVAGQVLVRGDGSGTLVGAEATKYMSGSATMLFMVQWSRLEAFNAVRSLMRHMSAPRIAHEKAMLYCMKYMVSTPNRGLVLAPDRIWDGSQSFKWQIFGRSDSDYAAKTDDRRSISGGRVFVNNAPVMVRSATQKSVTLSVCEAESAAGVMVAQDMLYTYNVLTSLELQVELPMILEMDNKGAVDLANNWRVGGRTRHVDVRHHFLRDLKDNGVIIIRHVSGDDNDADIFTKNVTGRIFERHIPMYVGHDEYIKGDAPNLG